MLAWIVIDGDRLVPWHLPESARFRGIRPLGSERANEATPKAAVSSSGRDTKRARLFMRR